MNPEDRQPNALRTSETAPEQTPAYGYVVKFPDGTVQCLTGYDRDIVVENLPASWGAPDPATFAPSPIRHGSITATDKHEPRHLNIYVASTHEGLRRSLITAAPIRIMVWVVRFNAAAVAAGETVDFATSGQTIESGILGKFGFSDGTIAAELTPEVYFQNGEVPRLYFSRRCNHALFGAGCGLDRDNSDFTFETIIATVDPVQRELIVSGQKPSVSADFFSSGQVFIEPLGLNFTVGWSSFASSDLKLKLTNWHPEIAASQTVVVRAGCRHTVADCRRLGNVANFGGFPHVPNRNPSVNSLPT